MNVKLTALLLCLVLLLGLTACSAATISESSTTIPTTTTPIVPPAAPEASISTEEDFDEIVLVNNEDICFKITAVKQDPIWGYTLKVFLENKTDKDVMFSVDNVSVNGFMCDPFWAEIVSAGKKSNSSIYWFENDFEENGIAKVEEIAFTLQAYDNNDYLADNIFLETFTVSL